MPPANVSAFSSGMQRTLAEEAVKPLRHMQQEARAKARQGDLTVVDPNDLLCPGERLR